MATANLSPVPQQTWIHSGSVRDNITFSAKKEEIDFARLNAVLDACALRADVQAMPDGDLGVICVPMTACRLSETKDQCRR